MATSHGGKAVSPDKYWVMLRAVLVFNSPALQRENRIKNDFSLIGNFQTDKDINFELLGEFQLTEQKQKHRPAIQLCQLEREPTVYNMYTY